MNFGTLRTLYIILKKPASQQYDYVDSQSFIALHEKQWGTLNFYYDVVKWEA